MTIAAVKDLLGEHGGEILQFAGYVAVSAVAFIVDFSVYWALLNVMHFAFAAACGGYVCGVLAHYLMSSRIVFRGRFHKRGVVDEAPTVAKFFAAGASGLLVTAAVVGVLADVMGVHPLLAKVCAAGCSFTVVFLTLRVFVFNARPKSDPQLSAAAV